ncbi:MAG TPA: nucleotidyltransferase domain-containing protein [Solirubrobacteraceae bacterium]|jgi:predicted nucleotidyltransferase
MVERNVYFPETPKHFGRYHALRDNWRHSRDVMLELRKRFDREDLPGVETIAIAGSFARFEASPESDADCIIILEDATEDQQAAAAHVLETVARVLMDLDIPEPNPTGVFASPRRLSELLPPMHEGRMGSETEETDVLSKRLLMLLESRPVWNDGGYEAAIEAIFERYERYVVEDQTKEHLLLLNHLIHYFRYICVNYESNFHRQNDKWPLRNLKLRHSRIVMYMGLLVLLGEASKHTDGQKLATVRENLVLPPLERIAKVYALNRDTSFFRVAGLYNTFLARISDATTRAELNGVGYEDRYSNVLFSALKANSDALQAELSRFIYARRGQWSERFFEYLIF